MIVEKLSSWFSNKVTRRDTDTTKFYVDSGASGTASNTDPRVNALLTKQANIIFDGVRKYVDRSTTINKKIIKIDRAISSLQRISDISKGDSAQNMLLQMGIWSSILKVESLVFGDNQPVNISKLREILWKLSDDIKIINFDESPYDTLLGDVVSLSKSLDEVSDKSFVRTLPMRDILYTTITKLDELVKIKQKKLSDISASKSDTDEVKRERRHFMGGTGASISARSHEELSSDDDLDHKSLNPNTMTNSWDSHFSNTIGDTLIVSENPSELINAIIYDTENCLSTSLCTPSEARLKRINTLLQHTRDIKRDHLGYEELLSEISIIQSILLLETQLKTPNSDKADLQNTIREVTARLSKGIEKKESLFLLFHMYANETGILPHLVSDIRSRSDLSSTEEVKNMLVATIKVMANFKEVLEDYTKQELSSDNSN